MGRSKRKKFPGNDLIALPQVASQQKQQTPKASPTTTPGRGGPSSAESFPRPKLSLEDLGHGGPRSAVSSPGPQLSLDKLAHGGSGMSSSRSNYYLPTITRRPGPLRQAHNHGSALQRTPGNQAAVLKIEYMSKIATWAVAEVPSLGAFYGERLASTCQSAGIRSPVLNSQCERCESVLLPGVNCSVRVTPNKKAKKKTREKGKAGEAMDTVNMVVYQCHYCKYGNKKPGTLKQHVKTKLAQAAARAQMKDLASSRMPSATTDTTTQGLTKASGGDSSPTPVTPEVSLPAGASPASAHLADHSISKKRKRRRWTGLKAIATLQNRELPTPERLAFAEDFTSLNPRKVSM